MTQGVLQPGIEPTGIGYSGIQPSQMAVYPNPVETTLFIQPSFDKSGSLEYLLTDAAGRKVQASTLKLNQGNERKEINMASFAAGQYTLNLIWTSGAQRATGTYKIQKLQ